MPDRPQIRVTERLREQWRQQLEQSHEERTHDQSGNPRDAMSIAIVDFDIKVTEYLLSLPLGTKFNAQDVQDELLKEEQDA